MPTVQRILFLNDKLRDDVEKFWFDSNTGRFKVVFKVGDGRQFSYSSNNVDVLEKVEELVPPFRVSRTSDGVIFHKILGVNVFRGKKNTAFRVLYEDGSAKNYPSSYLSVEEHIDDFRSINVLDYLKEVAKYSVIPVDEEKTISLADKYNRSSFVGKKSLMEAFLNPSTYTDKITDKTFLIFPFGCNRSQYEAVKNALSSRLSVVQGPPGTGKTQTILNVIANLIIEEKTVEVVSNNNSAVENVLEKLSKYDLGFLVAELGKSTNKKAFIESQTGQYPDMSDWEIDDIGACKTRIRVLCKELQSLYEKNERVALISESLHEYKHQLSKHDDVNEYYDISTRKLLKLLTRCQLDLQVRRGRFSLYTRYLLWSNKLPRDKGIVGNLEVSYYRSIIDAYEKELEECSAALMTLNQKSKELTDLSMRVLKGILFERYSSRKDRVQFKDDYYLQSQSFLKEYPIVLSTTFSATTNLNSEVQYDYLIMDEASQVDIAAGALALNCAKRAVVVGDLKQLPNVVDLRMEELSNAVFAKYDIPENYRFAKNSFLKSLCELLPGIPHVMLKEHYRCDPLIIGFCNKQFYDGVLVPMKHDSSEFSSVRVVRTSKGNHARGAMNERQATVIVDEILPAMMEVFPEVGIIAPYNAQVSLIKSLVKEKGLTDIPVATVHKFQGREESAIILSTVDNQIGEFADDPHLLNVAVSRAKDQFVLVVSGNEQPDSNVRDLVDYIEYYQGSSEISQIQSVFDLLYSELTKERIDFLRRHKRVSEYDSENLMYGLLEDILKSENLPHIGILFQYPLRLLFNNSCIQLSGDQRKYVSRSWAHVDFLLYNTISRKPVLAIEVDGHSFHVFGYSKDSDKQHSRDAVKDSVFEATDLPLLRLSTTGSGERDKIVSILKSSNNA